jgi:hypothetical protein
VNAVHSTPEHGHSHHGGQDHDHGHPHGGHTHGLVDPSIIQSRAGVRAVSLSLAVLLTTSVVQFVVFLLSDSVALLTDVIHNGGDALTAIPLGIAFLLRSRRFVHPQTSTHLAALFVAGVVGVIGNEVAAVIRWRAGRQPASPALIADGNHARADPSLSGFTETSPVGVLSNDRSCRESGGGFGGGRRRLRHVGFLFRERFGRIVLAARVVVPLG